MGDKKKKEKKKKDKKPKDVVKAEKGGYDEDDGWEDSETIYTPSADYGESYSDGDEDW